MTAFDPIEYRLEPTSNDRFGRPENFRARCAAGGRAAYFIPLLIFNVGVLLIAVVEAWLARNIATEFQESEHIYRALGGITLVLFVGIPVLILASENENANVFIVAAVTFIFCISILLNLFVPKMLYEKGRREKGKTHISGLQSSDTNSSTNVKHGAKIPSMTSEASDDTDTAGDKILSTKTRRQLIEENEKLKQEILRLQEQEGHPIVTA